MNKILAEVLLVIFIIAISMVFWNYFNSEFVKSQRTVVKKSTMT